MLAISRKSCSAIWLLQDWVKRLVCNLWAGFPIANNHAELRMSMCEPNVRHSARE